MNKKSYLACVLTVLVAGAASFLLQACDSKSADRNLPGGGGDDGFTSVTATLVGSPAEVASGPPGAYYISEDRTRFYLRCPGGRCTKYNALPLAAHSSTNVWELSGTNTKPTLSPSIHWFETDGVTTHWHGWLRNGVFTD